MSENENVLDSLFRVTKTNPTGPKDEIVMIVDRSGSMGSILTDAEGGVNSFIEEQKKVDGGANFTLVEFDNEIETVCEQIDIQEANPYKLVPRGMTSLLDAIGMTVNNISPEDGAKVIVVVVTDGDENSSHEYTHKAITTLIEGKREGGWEFIFLAANQDAIQTGATMGFAADSSISFDATGDGVRHAYNVASTYSTTTRTVSSSAAVEELKKLKGEDSDSEE